MRGRFPGGGGMNNLMRQAQQMQNRLKKTQEELAQVTYEGSAGGGAARVTLQGDSKFISVELSEDAVRSADRELLQDLLLTAMNDALARSKAHSAQELEKIAGPGAAGLF